MTLVRKLSPVASTGWILAVSLVFSFAAAAQTSAAADAQRPTADSGSNVPDLLGERGPHIRHPEAVKALDQLKSPY